MVTAFDYEDIKNSPVTKYGTVSKETLWQNLEYFLKAVVPEAEKAGIKLAMHPDDPQVDSVRGISRIMTTVPNFDMMLKLYSSPNNGITMCQGNFSLMGVDIPDTIKHFGKEKIHFVHFWNVRGGKFKFEETFHDEGHIDMYIKRWKRITKLVLNVPSVQTMCPPWPVIATNTPATVPLLPYTPLATCAD